MGGIGLIKLSTRKGYHIGVDDKQWVLSVAITEMMTDLPSPPMMYDEFIGTS